MAPAATNPATVQPPSALTLGGLPSQCLPVGGGGCGERQPRRPSQPFPGDVATPGCAPSGSGLCSEGGPASPLPGGGRSTGALLEFSHRSPSCARGTVLHCPVLQPVGGGGAGDLPDPRASPQRLEFVCPCLGRSRVPGCLHPHGLRSLRGLVGRVGLGSRFRCPPCGPPFLPPQAPGLRDHRKAAVGCGTLASLGLEVPCPPPPGLGQASSAQDQRGAAWTGRAAQREGPGGASPRHPWPVRVLPSGCLAPSPHVPSVPLPTGRHPARRMPPCASHAAVCGVAPSPPGAGLARPPLPSTRSPGRSFADF